MSLDDAEVQDATGQPVEADSPSEDERTQSGPTLEELVDLLTEHPKLVQKVQAQLDKRLVPIEQWRGAATRQMSEWDRRAALVDHLADLNMEPEQRKQILKEYDTRLEMETLRYKVEQAQKPESDPEPRKGEPIQEEFNRHWNEWLCDEMQEYAKERGVSFDLVYQQAASGGVKFTAGKDRIRRYARDFKALIDKQEEKQRKAAEPSPRVDTVRPNGGGGRVTREALASARSGQDAKQLLDAFYGG